MRDSESQRRRQRRPRLSSQAGELVEIDGCAFITQSGLLRIAHTVGCGGITVSLVPQFSEPALRRWVFRALVYKNEGARPFIGYGDADPSNISPNMLGCELRIAETRAVNRALR